MFSRMRIRLLLCTLAALLLAPVPAQATAWRVLDPIYPAGDPVKYPKGLALDTSGPQPGAWLTDVGHFNHADSVFKFPLGASPAGGSSPLQVLPPQLQWQNGTNVDGATSYPGGVAVDPVSHNVFVADSDNSRILRVSPTGRVTAVSAAGLVDRPHGLFVSGSTLLAAEPSAHRIARLNLDLTAALGTALTSPDFRSGPAEFTVDPASGEIWAPDEGYRVGEDDGLSPDVRGRVVELSATGRTLRTITGPDFGQLYGAALDTTTERLYVGDYTGDLIRVFDTATGAQVDTIPDDAFTRAFVAPVGMVIDPIARVLYVADVGADPFHNPFNPSIQRIALDPPGPTATHPPEAADALRLAFGKATLRARRRGGRIRLRGLIAVRAAAGAAVAPAACTGRVRLLLGRSVRSARSRPLAIATTWLTGPGCRIPVSLGLPARRAPRRAVLAVQFQGDQGSAPLRGTFHVGLR
jgi:DNA-binding beta-propeller fold protein YncE